MGKPFKAVWSPQRAMKMQSLVKCGLGTPTITGSSANFCDITDNGAGDYTVTFTDKPYAKIPEVFIQMSTVGTRAEIFTLTNTAVRVKTYGYADATPTEADFQLMAVGSDAGDFEG